MRRHHDSVDGSGGAGSDSFLDIVANIVGILIILIVIVGLRVAHTPPEPVAVPAVNSKPQPPPPPPAEGIVNAIPLLAMSVDPYAKTKDENFFGDVPLAPAPKIPEAPQPSAALLTSIENANVNRALALQAAKEARIAIARLDSEIQALLARRNGNQTDVASLEELQKKRSQLLIRAETVVADGEKRVREATAALQAASKPKPKTIRKLQHRIAPIGKQVRGEEVHFHLKDGRITAVPLKPLLEELRGRLKKRRSWLIRRGSATGEVGPIAGWNMQYAFEARNALEHGPGVVQIALAKWQLVPGRNIPSESPEQAMKSNSRFRRASRGASTVTIWVYADSFEQYRKLAEYAHDLGFRVAARPLPAGSFISGSPRGTRSVSQ